MPKRSKHKKERHEEEVPPPKEIFIPENLQSYFSIEATRVDWDLPYLPKPNKVEVVMTSLVAPKDLTPTAFALPFLEDGRCVFARNKRRGIEIPGGHVNRGETLEQAAIRETHEETGCLIKRLVPIGFSRSQILGEIPDDYRAQTLYPYPFAFQQFYAAIVEDTQKKEYEPNEECNRPMTLAADAVDGCLGPFRKGHIAFYKTAASLLFPKKWRT